MSHINECGVLHFSLNMEIFFICRLSSFNSNVSQIYFLDYRLVIYTYVMDVIIC